MNEPDLMGFALEMVDIYVRHGRDIDALQVREAMHRHGVLFNEPRTGSCGDACRCAQKLLADEMVKGFTCERRTPVLVAAWEQRDKESS